MNTDDELIDKIDDKKYIPKHASVDIENSDNQQNNIEKEMKEKKLDDSHLSDEASSLSEKEVNVILEKTSEIEKPSNFEDDFWGNTTIINKKVKRKNKRNITKVILVVIILIILIGVMMYSSFKILGWQIDNKKTNDITNKIENISEIEVVEDTNNTEIINEEEDKDNPYWYYITFPLINVDIGKLKEQNNDTVGFINVNNTNINYPFVQTSDNDYYLTHSFDKSENEAGWLFLDYRNNSDFSNRNNIIYGHSRLNKTMFGSLSKVLKYEWYSNKDNHIIRLSLKNENTLWQIFSVYKIKTESYYITTDFYNDKDYLEFLNIIKERSLYDFDANLTSDDKILTLSTCYSETERTVVHARLIKRSVKE